MYKLVQIKLQWLAASRDKKYGSYAQQHTSDFDEVFHINIS